MEKGVLGVPVGSLLLSREIWIEVFCLYDGYIVGGEGKVVGG